MPIQLTCSCGQFYELPDELSGKKARCQVCKNIMVVPSASVQPAQPQANQPMAAQPVQPNVQPPQASPSGQTPTQPNVAQPLQQQPNATYPSATQPGAMQPGAMQPGAMQPSAMQPGAMQPGAMQSNQLPAQPLNQPQQGYPAQPQLYGGQPQAPGATFQKKSAASPNAKLYWIGGGVGGTIVIILVVYFLFSGGGSNENSEQTASNQNQPSSENERPKRKTGNQPNSSNTGANQKPKTTQPSNKSTTQNKKSPPQKVVQQPSTNQNPKPSVNQTNKRPPVKIVLQPKQSKSTAPKKNTAPDIRNIKNISTEMISNSLAKATALTTEIFKDGIEELRVSADGKLVALEPDERDGLVIWSPPTGKSKRIPGSEKFELMAFDPAGKHIAGMKANFTIRPPQVDIRVWNIGTDEEVISANETMRFDSGEFTPDGKFLVLSSERNATQNVYNLATGKRRKLSGHIFAFKTIDADSKRLLGFDISGQLAAIQISNGKKSALYNGMRVRNNDHIAVTPNYLALYGEGSKLQLVDAKAKKVLDTIELQLNEDVYRVYLANNGETGIVVVFKDEDAAVKLISFVDKKLKVLGELGVDRRVLKTFRYKVADDGSKMFADVFTRGWGNDSRIAVWEIDKNASPSGNLTNSSSEPSIKFVDNSIGAELIKTSPPMLVAPRFLRLSKNGEVGVVHAFNELLFRWDVKNNKMETFNKEKKPIRIDALRDDGRLLFMGHDASIWDMTTGKSIRRLLDEDTAYFQVAGLFNEDKAKFRMFAGGDFLEWDLKKNKVVNRTQANVDGEIVQLTKVQFFENGRAVAFARTGEYYLFDQNKLLKKGTWKERGEAANIFALSHDGKVAIINDYQTSKPKAIRIDLETGKATIAYQLNSAINILQFGAVNADASIVIVGQEKGSRYHVPILKFESGQYKKIGNLPTQTIKASFGADGKTIMTCSDDKRIRLWRLN